MSKQEILFKGGKMKVYIVFSDNGEQGEDYNKLIRNIFLNKKKAEEYMESQLAKTERGFIYNHLFKYWVEEWEVE